MNNFITKDKLDIIKKFSLFDDTFMSKVFEDADCVRLLIDIVFNRVDIALNFIDTQHTITNLHGHSIRVDVLAQNELYTFNVEVQKDKSGALPQRPRYYSSLLDSQVFDAGMKYDVLPATYVGFICKSDVLAKGLPIYHIDRTIRETLDDFEDESHIVYVNGEIQDSTRLGKLMHDFHCTEAKDMYYPELRKRVNYLKEGSGIVDMCKLMEDYGQKRQEVGEEIGKNQSLVNAIINILKKKFGNIAPDIIIKIEASPTYKLEQLIVDILDAQNENDVNQMLNN